jgi:branched-chain amino acid transport system permease protein
VSAIVLRVTTATRDLTGGSLGYTPEQFLGKETWYLTAPGIWGVALLIRYRVERSTLRYALEAIAEDGHAAAAAGVHVTAEKLKITVLSAMMTAFAGALYCQYQMFISPDTVGGIGVSLQMVFAAVVGGLYVPLGPTVGAATLRIPFGTAAVGWDNLVYGTLLVLFIIFLPQGLLGSVLAMLTRREVVRHD